MHKLDIGLGWSVIREKCTNGEDISDFWEIIKRHKIITSTSLIDYYLSKADEDKIDKRIIQNLIYSMNGYTVEARCKNATDPSTIFATHFKNKQYDSGAIVFNEQDEIKCSKSACKNQFTIKDIMDDDDNIIRQYTPTYAFDLPTRSKCKPAMRWLGNIFRNAKRIIIIDPHVFDHKSGVYTFKNFILPSIAARTQLELHLKQETKYLTLCDIKSECEKNDIDVKIYLHNSTAMHGRYLFFERYDLNNDLGWDLVDKNIGNGDEIRQATRLTLIDQKHKYWDNIQPLIDEKAGAVIGNM